MYYALFNFNDHFYLIFIENENCNNLSIEKIKILPLGKYIYIIVNKVINLWSKSNNFWIYYLSISLFIMMLGATYGLYACLIILN